jgi:LL-diaminopimelate aminotransferase
VPYIVQRGAEATYSAGGNEQIRKLIGFYLENAKLIREGLSAAGFKTFGGVHAPYVWVKTPGNTSSWDFFDQMLTQANIVVTPGSGFGISGEGYFRVSAFNRRENVQEAIARINKAFAA